MELIILLTLSIITFLLSLIAVGFSIYNYIQFKVFTSSTQALPVIPDVNEIANNLFSDSVSREDINALKMAKNLSAEELV